MGLIVPFAAAAVAYQMLVGVSLLELTLPISILTWAGIMGL